MDPLEESTFTRHNPLRFWRRRLQDQVWSYQTRRCLFTLNGHLDYVRTSSSITSFLGSFQVLMTRQLEFGTGEQIIEYVQNFK